MRRLACILLLVLALAAQAVPAAAWADECPEGGAHEYEAVLVRQASDDADGLRRFTCVKCGDSFDQAIPATGHEWGPWEVVVEATYESEGLERRVCAHDASHVQERIIPALESVVSQAVEPEAAPEPEAEPEPEPETASEPAPEPALAEPAGPAPELPAAEEPAPSDEVDPWAPNALDAVLLGVDVLAIAAFAGAAAPLLAARRFIIARRAAARTAAVVPTSQKGGRVL